MWDGLRLAWRLLRDPRVAPRLKTGVPLLAALYVLSPLDLLPDLLLGPGQVDDLGVVGLTLLFLLRVLPRLAPSSVLAEHLVAMGLAEEQTTGAAGPVIDAEYRVRDGGRRA